MIAGTQAAAIQEQRRFSRQNEQEADRIGIQNLERPATTRATCPTCSSAWRASIATTPNRRNSC
jgi:predicted Zn-dependent protease